MIAVLCGCTVGLALGLTGGGGSVFAVPLLIYLLGVPVREAINVSLAVVASTAAVGALDAWRTNLMEYRAGLIFAAGGMIAAPLGVRIGRWVPDPVTLAAFACLMIVVAAYMWQKARREPGASEVVRVGLDASQAARGQPICRFSADQRLVLTAPCSALLATTGVVTGLLSGFFGVGGGFIIVPALTMVTQMSIHRAVATSLFVITLVAGVAFGSAWFDGQRVPYAVTGLFLGGGIAGMAIGRILARRIAGPKLQQVFAAAILIVGIAVLASHLFETR